MADGTVNVSPNHTHSSSLSVTLTIACSILLSMATTLAPDALWGERERGEDFNHESSRSCIQSNSDYHQHFCSQQRQIWYRRKQTRPQATILVTQEVMVTTEADYFQIFPV